MCVFIAAYLIESSGKPGSEWRFQALTSVLKSRFKRVGAAWPCLGENDRTFLLAMDNA